MPVSTHISPRNTSDQSDHHQLHSHPHSHPTPKSTRHCSSSKLIRETVPPVLCTTGLCGVAVSPVSRRSWWISGHHLSSNPNNPPSTSHKPKAPLVGQAVLRDGQPICTPALHSAPTASPPSPPHVNQARGSSPSCTPAAKAPAGKTPTTASNCRQLAAAGAAPSAQAPQASKRLRPLRPGDTTTR